MEPMEQVVVRAKQIPAELSRKLQELLDSNDIVGESKRAWGEFLETLPRLDLVAEKQEQLRQFIVSINFDALLPAVNRMSQNAGLWLCERCESLQEGFKVVFRDDEVTVVGKPSR
jgi:hypothetical protein